MKNFLLLLCLLAAFTFTSCSKDDDSSNDPAPAVPVDPATDPAAMQLTGQLLTAHGWKLTGLTQGVAGQGIQNDIYNNTYPACKRDDVFSFSNPTLRDFIVYPYTNNCTPNESPIAGAWVLKNAKTLVINAADLKQPGLTGEFSIFLLNNTTMVLHQTINGNEYVATFEEFVPPIIPNNTQLLTASPWRIASLVMQLPGSPPDDIYNSVDPCEKDNYFRFYPDFTAEGNEGPTKCDPTDPQIFSLGTWAFKNNETMLNLDGDDHEILSLTATNLTLKFTESATNAVFTYHFVK